MTDEEKIKALEKENAELKESNTLLGKDLAERDTTISDLKKNAKERSEQFKKLKDMTDAEKELLTEKELEVIKRQEALEEEITKTQNERNEYNKKMKDSTINNIATRLAKGDKDLTEQIKINLKKLNPELLEKAVTEEELAPYVSDAFNLTGVNSKNDSVQNAHNTGGGNAPIDTKQDFSKTPEGGAIGKALGLSFTSEDNKA